MDGREKTPVLLLKTKSAPTDGYEEYFSALDNSRYAPVFVPVLEHRFKQEALRQVRQHVVNGDFTRKYGALVFTSQRAVEAFAEVVQELRGEGVCPLHSQLPQNLPLYVVGPATARGLRALNTGCPILGEETGNGDALASYILDHYNSIYPSAGKPAILFLVGEKRRDIIPRTLQSGHLPPERRTQVDELVIYETGEMQSFKADFTSLWKENAAKAKARQWVVVFSPTGCQAMLESLGLLDAETGQSKWQSSKTSEREVLIATIGPTTRDYLVQEFDVAPDVCAEKPSPEGLGEVAKKQTTIEESTGDEAAKHDKKKEGTTSDENENVEATTKQPDSNVQTEEDTVQDSSQREKELPSSILEKGVIYFFTRNRVSVEEAESVGDLQRTYFVLHYTCSNDRFMAFVEKAQTTIQELKDDFFKGSDYETKTSGTRHVDPVTPIAEGVYAITRTEDTSTHLAYAITIPSDLGEVQEDLGIRPQGSFVINVKNPERPGPASANLPQGPDFPKEIIEEFRNLAWAKVKPKYLDFPNAQILLIGEELESGTEPTTKDQRHGKEEPAAELERLEHEDEVRVEHLRGDDSVFDDLRLSKDEFSKVPTTW
ncbi:tetrapyrrole biosynthesis, uroporphyrinogen III synthase [Massarina eburnea CBS 473.64]|uniref:Tetrapyrrole biosynthesis, uroporphyrinogen III synthase n=1 Tax=Massarina eburnea CBS 473.64 TaxID=1395130 RepID=A0A6A6RNQ8_9PLEO|nr:tetrapyrrole biosynthesis, uroporphyrinogen III synthase [Massarina eburnea CBS 473.64]